MQGLIAADLFGTKYESMSDFGKRRQSKQANLIILPRKGVEVENPENIVGVSAQVPHTMLSKFGTDKLLALLDVRRHATALADAASVSSISSYCA